MADINVGTMTLAQMVGRIIERQDTLAGGEWILSMIETLTAERDEARMERQGHKDAYDEQTADHMQTRRELAEARANLRLAEIRINGFIGAQEDAEAEVAKLKPYAFVQIAKLKRDSAIEELDGAEDEEERQQCARELGDWHEMAFRATNLMREQWERDRKTMVRVELGDMVKAACS